MDKIVVGPLLDGKLLTDAGGGFVDVMNPATGQTIAQQACCDSTTVEQLVESSDRAFHSKTWQTRTPTDRGVLLLKVAELLESEVDTLVELELVDTGKMR